MGSKKEYLFSYSTGLFHSRPTGDKTFKKVKRINGTSIPKSKRLNVVRNAGTLTK